MSSKDLPHLNLKKLDDQNFSFERFYDPSVKIEEKVTDAIWLINNLDTTEWVSKIFNKLKLEKSNLLIIYEIIFSKIKEEMMLLVEDIFNMRLQNVQLEREMDHISSEMKIKTGSINLKTSAASEVPTSSKEYVKFLAHYEKSLFLSQEIIKKKMRITMILDTQKILDKEYVEKMIGIDYQIIKLNEVISDFAKFKSVAFVQNYDLQFNKTKDLEEIILEKDKSFDDLIAKMNIKTSGVVFNIKDKNLGNAFGK